MYVNITRGFGLCRVGGNSHMMYVPIRIDQFEIVDSWMNEGKKCLVMQASYIDKSTGEISKYLIWTEAYKLIEDIKGTELTLPHYTKISRNGRYMFYVQLNEKEKYPLLNL